MALVLIALAFVAAWRSEAPLPEPRSEVAAARVGASIVVVGGFRADASSSSRVDAYSTATRSWRRLPDLPVEVNHAMAAADRDRLYVVGGYAPDGSRRRDAFVLDGARWRRLPSMPSSRAAGGAAVIGRRLYVAGGVSGTPAARRLARFMLALDLRTGRWATLPGPTAREHLGVVAAAGKLYAAGGRSYGYDTNVATVEAYAPATGRWRTIAPLPSARGGTGLAAVPGGLVSAGGEEPAGAIASVYRYAFATGRWTRLPDLPRPRHGLGVVGVGARVYVVAGGPTPGLSVSGANESIAG